MTRLAISVRAADILLKLDFMGNSRRESCFVGARDVFCTSNRNSRIVRVNIAMRETHLRSKPAASPACVPTQLTLA